MKEISKNISITLGIIVMVFLAAWLVQGGDFFMYKFFAPKYEQVRRETFEQTRSFNVGMVTELENMQVAYETEKNERAKRTLADVILHRASGYNLDDPAVPFSLKVFIEDLRTKERSK